MRRAVLALLVCLIAAPSLAQETLKPGDTISGKLRFFQHQHPNGTWINVYQLTADNPRKFAKDDEFCDPDKPPKTFHLLVMNDKAKKRQPRQLSARRRSRLSPKTSAARRPPGTSAMPSCSRGISTEPAKR